MKYGDWPREVYVRRLVETAHRLKPLLLRSEKNWLGGLDSNQDSQIQNLESCQLDDLPVGKAMMCGGDSLEAPTVPATAGCADDGFRRGELRVDRPLRRSTTV